MHVVSTAGHVDHGKSTLVLALTGTDPDRFAEEKQRGLTIDLGFASALLPSGRRVSFVDVPGHVRFLKNMLAGVGGVSACIFIVAATEGWKPQSEEHLRILDLLGLKHGLIVLTKVAIADEESREIALLDIEEHVAGTFLEGAKVVQVDSVEGVGLEELRASLDELLEQAPTALDHDRPRLWVDRSFTIKGSGAVVTGTLLGGKLSVEDKLLLVAQQSESHNSEVRVRGIQNHDQAIDQAVPGSRVALNLVGVGAADIQRGDVLVRSGQWHQSSKFDASLTVLESLSHDVSRRGAYVVYIGSGEFPVKLRVLGTQDLLPGETGSVRVHLPHKLPLLPGDHYVLREFGRAETAGGGQVVDVAPLLPASKAQPLCWDGTSLDFSANAERIVRERGWLEAGELALLTGEAANELAQRWRVGSFIAWPQALESVRQDIREMLSQSQVDLATLSQHQRAALAGMEGLEIEGGLVRLAGQTDSLAEHPYLQALSEELFMPPAPEGIARTDLRAMLHRGLVVEAGGVFFAPRAVATAIEAMEDLWAREPAGFTVAVIRERLGTTRKYIMPLLEILDGAGVTRRQGDLRTPGPRLAEAKAGFG